MGGTYEGKPILASNANEGAVATRGAPLGLYVSYGGKLKAGHPENGYVFGLWGYLNYWRILPGAVGVVSQAIANEPELECGAGRYTPVFPKLMRLLVDARPRPSWGGTGRPHFARGQPATLVHSRQS